MTFDGPAGLRRAMPDGAAAQPGGTVGGRGRPLTLAGRMPAAA